MWNLVAFFFFSALAVFPSFHSKTGLLSYLNSRISHGMSTSYHFPNSMVLSTNLSSGCPPRRKTSFCSQGSRKQARKVSLLAVLIGRHGERSLDHFQTVMGTEFDTTAALDAGKGFAGKLQVDRVARRPDRPECRPCCDGTPSAQNPRPSTP